MHSVFTKKEESWEFNEKIDGQILEIYPLLIKFMIKTNNLAKETIIKKGKSYIEMI